MEPPQLKRGHEWAPTAPYHESATTTEGCTATTLRVGGIQTTPIPGVAAGSVCPQGHQGARALQSSSVDARRVDGCAPRCASGARSRGCRRIRTSSKAAPPRDPGSLQGRRAPAAVCSSRGRRAGSRCQSTRSRGDAALGGEPASGSTRATAAPRRRRASPCGSGGLVSVVAGQRSVNTAARASAPPGWGSPGVVARAARVG